MLKFGKGPRDDSARDCVQIASRSVSPPPDAGWPGCAFSWPCKGAQDRLAALDMMAIRIELGVLPRRRNVSDNAARALKYESYERGQILEKRAKRWLFGAGNHHHQIDVAERKAREIGEGCVALRSRIAKWCPHDSVGRARPRRLASSSRPRHFRVATNTSYPPRCTSRETPSSRYSSRINGPADEQTRSLKLSIPRAHSKKGALLRVNFL
jgi:hypothetical protein